MKTEIQKESAVASVSDQAPEGSATAYLYAAHVAMLPGGSDARFDGLTDEQLTVMVSANYRASISEANAIEQLMWIVRGSRVYADSPDKIHTPE